MLHFFQSHCLQTFLVAEHVVCMWHSLESSRRGWWIHGHTAQCQFLHHRNESLITQLIVRHGALRSILLPGRSENSKMHSLKPLARRRSLSCCSMATPIQKGNEELPRRRVSHRWKILCSGNTSRSRAIEKCKCLKKDTMSCDMIVLLFSNYYDTVSLYSTESYQPNTEASVRINVMQLNYICTISALTTLRKYRGFLIPFLTEWLWGLINIQVPNLYEPYTKPCCFFGYFINEFFWMNSCEFLCLMTCSLF